MATNATRLSRFLILVWVLVMLTGCASTSVISRSLPSAFARKMESAKVVWKEKTNFPVSISVKGHTINEVDKLAAQKIISQLRDLFNQRLAITVREQLALNNVVDGDGVILEITPVTSSVHFVNYTAIKQGFTARASIRDAVYQQELWYVTINTLDNFDKTDQTPIDNYVAVLMSELKSAGWLN